MAPRTNQTPITKYKTLIARAHQCGLTNIATELIQIPTAENGNVAIARAVVTFEVDGSLKTFEDYGDADKGNVGPMVTGALIRMAITRAKARCLRDALGEGDVSDTELAGYEEGAGDRGSERDRAERVSCRGSSPRSGPARTASGATRVINTSQVQCPVCFAPTGKAHAPGCREVQASAA